MKNFRTLLAVGLVVCLVSSAGADIIAEYNFDDNNGQVDQAGLGVTASDFTGGGGMSLTFDGTSGNGEAGEAFTSDEGFAEFTLSGLSGITLQELVFTIETERRGANRIAAYSLATWDGTNETPLSFDFYVPDTTDPTYKEEDDISSVSIGQGGDYLSSEDNDGTVVVDLSGMSLGDSVTFRINVVKGGGLGFQTSMDNVTVTGVPEPATMSLLALGGLGVLIRRRRS
jgi:hypothetical protein